MAMQRVFIKLYSKCTSIHLITNIFYTKSIGTYHPKYFATCLVMYHINIGNEISIAATKMNLKLVS